MSIYIFGDSFIGPFTLVDNKDLQVVKFKGATMRGITKKDNKNRLTIINKFKNDKNIKCSIFNFGQVDVFFTFYFKYVRNEKFEMEQMIKDYVEFIASLECNKCNKIIFAVFPHVVKDKDWFKALLLYGILTEEEINSISPDEKKRIGSMKFRFDLYQKFNKILENYAKEYNIPFIGFEDVLLDKNHQVKKKYVSQTSIYNIHLLWEPLIPHLIKKIKMCNIGEKYKVDLEKTLSKYKKENKKEIDLKIKNNK